VGERVLITGATGFIGSHLVEELIRLGYDVEVLVRKNSNLRWLRDKNVRYVYGDLGGAGSLPGLNRIDYIFHLGGATRAVRTKDYFRINLQGTEALLAAARGIKGLKGFIYLSSQAAAGPSPDDRPSVENDMPCPVSPYGKSKLQAEEAVLCCSDQFHVTILRPCAVYGPRDTYMLELFKQISKGIIPSVGGGSMYFSFCYVNDIVQVLLRSISHGHKSGEVFFIADGEKYSFDYFADVVSSVLGVKLRKIAIPSWAAWCYATVADGLGMAIGKPAAFSRNKCSEACCRNWVCDIGKAKNELGFRPGFLLESGVNITLKWYKEQGWL
jgi:dihydroflavonol-4-reductase